MFAWQLRPETQDFFIFSFPDSLIWSSRPLGMCFAWVLGMKLMRSEFSSIPSGWNVVLGVGGGNLERGSCLHPW